jgi:hypothetical protein
MPAREKQDYQDDEPNNQRQSGERYCEHNKIAADRHWIQQATEVEAKNYAWMNRAFIELAACRYIRIPYLGGLLRSDTPAWMGLGDALTSPHLGSRLATSARRDFFLSLAACKGAVALSGHYPEAPLAA